MKIPFFNTYIAPSAKGRVSAVLESTFISEGKLVKEFEAELARTLGWVNPIAVNSGTSALHLALLLAGVGPGDEVILPAQTFVATGLAVLYCGATPVFADIQYETGNIDPRSVRAAITKKTRAILVVHWAGYPCDMDEIQAIAQEHGLKVVEDAAHAPGAVYKDRPIGSISDFTCFSFQAIKHITTGDGGAVCVKDPELARQGLVSRWFGIDRAISQASVLGERQYDIATPGYKYHMNDYAATLGLANLENFQERMARRQKLVKIYQTQLAGADGIHLFQNEQNRQGAFWLFGLHVPERREEFIRALKAKNITCSVVHLGIDHNSIFGGKQTKLKNQRKFDDTQINLPIHDAMDEKSIQYVIDAVRAGW